MYHFLTSIVLKPNTHIRGLIKFGELLNKLCTEFSTTNNWQTLLHIYICIIHQSTYTMSLPQNHGIKLLIIIYFNKLRTINVKKLRKKLQCHLMSAKHFTSRLDKLYDANIVLHGLYDAWQSGHKLTTISWLAYLFAWANSYMG